MQHKEESDTRRCQGLSCWKDRASLQAAVAAQSAVNAETQAPFETHTFHYDSRHSDEPGDAITKWMVLDLEADRKTWTGPEN